MRRYTWRDGLFDVTWSEVNEPILVAAAGDGSVLIFDQNLADAPAMILPGHTAEVSPCRGMMLFTVISSTVLPPTFLHETLKCWERGPGNKATLQCTV